MNINDEKLNQLLRDHATALATNSILKSMLGQFGRDPDILDVSVAATLEEMGGMIDSAIPTLKEAYGIGTIIVDVF